jgi:hypothetical protein
MSFEPPHTRGSQITHKDAPQLVGLLWTSDQPIAETFTSQHTQWTNIHAPGRIQTRNTSKQSAVDTCLTPLRHCDRPLFNIYINDFHWQINTAAKVIMFADDTNTLVSHSNYDDFKNVFHHVLLHISKLFQANRLKLNVEKTNNTKIHSY